MYRRTGRRSESQTGRRPVRHRSPGLGTGGCVRKRKTEGGRTLRSGAVVPGVPAVARPVVARVGDGPVVVAPVLLSALTCRGQGRTAVVSRGPVTGSHESGSFPRQRWNLEAVPGQTYPGGRPAYVWSGRRGDPGDRYGRGQGVGTREVTPGLRRDVLGARRPRLLRPPAPAAEGVGHAAGTTHGAAWGGGVRTGVKG